MSEATQSFSIPIESNPEVLNKYIYKLGVSKDWQVVDIYGLEPDLLAFTPQPVKSVILLFPCSENYENHRKEEDKFLKKNPDTFSKDLFYTKQLSHNACGTISLIHGILNNKDIQLEENSVLKNYYEKAIDLSPEDRGKLLDSDTAFAAAHQAIAQEGQTAAPSSDDKIYHHFVAFVCGTEGDLLELDGRKNMPVKHGKTTANDFLLDAANVCKEFMARDPKELRFTVLAIASSK